MVSYTITACNEADEINKLLNFLRVHMRDSDEIIVQLDAEKSTDRVREVVSMYQNQITAMTVIEFNLNNDFASFKNNLKRHCKNEWIFNIDADEIPAAHLIDNIHDILTMNQELEMLLVPRWNMVEGITKEHIEKWRWNYDSLGRINWPDWQMRIYKNTDKIQWKNKVHEVLEGFEKYSFLPQEKDWCLFHNKTIERQEKQNNYYDTI